MQASLVKADNTAVDRPLPLGKIAGADDRSTEARQTQENAPAPGAEASDLTLKQTQSQPAARAAKAAMSRL